MLGWCQKYIFQCVQACRVCISCERQCMLIIKGHNATLKLRKKKNYKAVKALIWSKKMVWPKWKYFSSICLGSYNSSILYPFSFLKLLRCSSFITPRQETVMHLERHAWQGNGTSRKAQRITYPRRNQKCHFKIELGCCLIYFSSRSFVLLEAFCCKKNLDRLWKTQKTDLTNYQW